jgi:hypothetical protein
MFFVEQNIILFYDIVILFDEPMLHRQLHQTDGDCLYFAMR